VCLGIRRNTLEKVNIKTKVVNKSRQTWKQAFAEVNAMHLEALRKQEEIIMNTLFNREHYSTEKVVTYL
jgi:hypothetical protein